MHRSAVDNTAATRTLKLSTTPLRISCAIHLISFLIKSSVACVLFSQTLNFRYSPQEIVTRVEILGIGWPRVIGLTRNESVTWEVMPEVFKCSVQEMRCHFISRANHLNTSRVTSHETDSFCIKPITPGHPIPKISTGLTIFRVVPERQFNKTIHRQEGISSEEKSGGFHKKCSIELWTILMFELLLCYHTAARCMERT